MTHEITVWADIRCPWCWMGHRKLEALAATGRAGPVRYRSFLLEPEGPRDARTTVGRAAVTAWGMTEPQWAAQRDRIESAAAATGLTINIDSARMIDSSGAHRLLKLATARGVDPAAAWDALYAAHLRDNIDLEDEAGLRALGTGLGVPAADLDRLSGSTDFLPEVLADHRAARERGVEGVPAVLHRDRVLVGAHDTAELAAFLGAGSPA